MSKEHILKEFIRTKLSEAGMSSKFKKAVEEYKEVSLKLQDLFADRAKALEGYKKAEGGEKEKYKMELSRIQKLVNPLQDQMEKAERVFNKALLSEPEELEESVDLQDAYRLKAMADHQIGQNTAKEFLSKHNVNLEKLGKAIMQGVINSYELRDVINGKAHKFITKNFIKDYVKEGKHDKEIKALEDKIKAVKGKTPADLGLKAVMGDDLARLKAMNEGYSYANATKLELQQYLINLNIELSGEKNPKWIKYIKGDIEDVKKELQKRSNSKKESVNEASRRANEMFGETKFGQEIHKMLKGKWDAKKVEDYLDGLGGGSTQKNLRIIDFISKDAGLNPRLYDTQTLGKQISDLVDKLEVLYKDFTKGTDVKKFDDVHIKSKNLTGIVYAISGNTLVVKTASGMVKTTKDDVEAVMSDGVIKDESVNEAAYDQKIKSVMQNSTSSFKNFGNDFKKAGLKYNFSTTPFPHYIVEPGGNKKVAIVSRKNEYDLKGSGIQYSTYIATIKESVTEIASVSHVRSTIEKVKKQLIQKWKQKGGYENFGEKEGRMLGDKFNANPYGSSDERRIHSMIQDFENWAMNYDGRNESVTEAELPAATIPASIKSKLVMAIDKIKDTKLTYNQKTQIIGQVMDSLGIDKGEFNKMSSKLKGTMESSIKEGSPCWDGYQQIGMKEKGGKQVPNCVPEGKVNEGNAFGMAVTQVKKEGKKEFEFNGKTYKVKKGKGKVNESDCGCGSKAVVSEAKITSIPNLNLESDAYILMYNMLKNNSSFKSTVAKFLNDYFEGGRPANIAKALSIKLPGRVFDRQFIRNVVDGLNKKGPRIAVSDTQLKEIDILVKFGQILAAGLLFDFAENPMDVAKMTGDKSVIDAASEFSANRGRGKFKTMMGNRNEAVNEADVTKKINRKGDEDGLLVKHNGKEYHVVYSADTGLSTVVQPYGIVMPGDDTVSFLGRDKQAKVIWKQLKPKVDAFLKNESVNEAVNVRKLLQMNVARELKVSPSSIEVGVGNYGSRTANDGSQVVVIGLDANVKKISIPQADYFDTTVDYGGYLIVKADGKTGKLLKVLDRVKSQNDIRMADYIKEVNEAVKEPEVITKLRGILKNHQHASIKDPKLGKSVKVDAFSASAIVQVYDAINDANKAKFAAMSIHQMATVAYKLMKK